MTIANKLLRMKEDLDNVYEAGKAAGGGGDDYYDTFWKDYTQDGARAEWHYAFYGLGWTDNTYRPDRAIRITSASTGVFSGAKITSTRVPIVIATSGNCPNLFANNMTLRTIPMLDITDYTYGNYGGWFSYTSGLVDITVAGYFISSVSFERSSKLSKASIQSIYSALSSEAGMSANTITLSLVAVNKAFETSEGANDGSTSEEWSNLVSSTPWRTVLS